jgi:flagellar basal-body rod protein FlgF
MENLSYISLSQQMALTRQMDVTANNIANMNTPGFKTQGLLFKEYLNQTPNPQERISQVQSDGSYHDFAPGAMAQTSNKLDAAIQGNGYFTVQTPQGIRYTRDGAFSLNANGEIVTKAGFKIMADGNSALTIPQGDTDITIMGDGTISTENGAIGKLKIVSFDNEQVLVPEGNNLYNAGNAPEQPVETPDIQQGFLESSNVQPILEMNRMIEISRLYQAAQQIIMRDHDQQRSMIRALTEA